MNIARTARAATLPRIPRAIPNVRQWATRIFLFAFCLSSALLLTALRLEITRLEYELSNLHSQMRTVAADVSRLEVEEAALASSKRIEEMARKAGYVYPDPDSVVVLDE